MSASVCDVFYQSAPATVCRHISRILQCPVYYLLPNNSSRYAYTQGSPSEHADETAFFSALFCKAATSGYPAIKITRPGEAYIAVDLFRYGKFYGRLAAGPITCRRTTYYMDELPSAAEGDIDYIVSASVLLYHFVYGIWVDEDDLRKSSDYTSVQTGDNPHPPPHRQHHSIGYENLIYNLISQGNVKKLKEAIHTPPDGAYGLLDKNHPLRNLKNDCICIITLAARASIAGGLDSETALSLSDEAIQNIEGIENISDLGGFMEDVVLKFSRLVENVLCTNYSHRIRYCRNYIMNHIGERLTVSSVAKQFKLSPEYLSEQFSQETGESLKDFLDKARIEEAKRQLMFTNKPLFEIASQLHYHDQSHFTKSFKTHTGSTPGVFRKYNLESVIIKKQP